MKYFLSFGFFLEILLEFLQILWDQFYFRMQERYFEILVTTDLNFKGFGAK